MLWEADEGQGVSDEYSIASNFQCGRISAAEYERKMERLRMTMHPNDGKCSSGLCNRTATVQVTFTNGRKLPYCAACARKIGGHQTVIVSKD